MYFDPLVVQGFQKYVNLGRWSHVFPPVFVTLGPKVLVAILFFPEVFYLGYASIAACFFYLLEFVLLPQGWEFFP